MTSEIKIEKTIIFTDLDGTLLNHSDYSFRDAIPMLDFIKSHRIPLIIVTSKTQSEVISLQKALGIQSLFIFENGAGIYDPTNSKAPLHPMGFSYEKTREAFLRYKKVYPIRGFGDMEAEEIAGLADLTQNSAVMAKARLFSEPFILKDSQALADLTNMARADGFDIIKGGRFYHLITQGQDKAHAVAYVLALFEKEKGTSLYSIGLGDNYNDITMLQCVDQAVLIPKSDGNYIDFATPQMIKAPYKGPKGWNYVLKELLDG